MRIKHYLVIRLSAMGDVALAVPVIEAVLSQNQNIKLHILTRQKFRVFFKNIQNLEFVDFDINGVHKGFLGLLRLAKQINKDIDLDGVIDIHGVLRSYILDVFFGFLGVKIFRINKGRKSKRLIINRKKITPLKHTSQRYIDVFQAFGLKADLNLFLKTRQSKKDLFKSQLLSLNRLKKKHTYLGIAPFAAFESKTYPLSLMKKIIQELIKLGNTQIFIFGGGQKDQLLIKDLLDFDTKNLVENRVKDFDLEDQLGMISKMKVMLTMDSANMHLARLVDVPVISIWGPTHPFFGFGALGQKREENILQVSIDKLKCRPCSFFGNKPCIHEELYCFSKIPIYQIINLVKKELEK